MGQIEHAKFSNVCDVESELNFMMENAGLDDEWNMLPEEAKKLLKCPKKDKTKKVYNRYWKLYTRHCLRENVEMFTKISVIGFFMEIKKKFSKGSLWSIYSCLNHNFKIKKKINLKVFTRLKLVLKRLTEGYVPRKSPVFTEQEMHEIFEKLEDDVPVQLIAKVGVALMYYGLLRREEVLEIQLKDVVVRENGEITVRFPYATKTKDDGFEYYVPTKLIPSFTKYLTEIDKSKARNTRFLKNMNIKNGFRTQNCGEKGVERWIELIGDVLGKNTKD